MAAQRPTTPPHPDETPIERFARLIIGRVMYPYQAEIANAILESVAAQRGDLFTVMMSRQSGKNETSAMLEAFLLATHREGFMVKAAPTFSPQIINSRARLMMMLENPFLADRVWTSYGQVGLTPTPHPSRALRQRHLGPSVKFFSADPNSNVVGATASILLEIDEAQDVSPEKFSKDFRPMASTTNATTVLYGTAWSEDTLLAQSIAANHEAELQDGRQRNFRFDWQTLAQINPNYKTFVESEIVRLGADHPIIKTQFMLLSISGAGYFFNDLQRELMKGSHTWQDEPDEDAVYIAGIDVAGEDERPKIGELVTRTRDSTVVTIGKVEYTDLDLPALHIVHQEWWTGMQYSAQYAAIVALTSQWNIRRLVIDKTGLGAALASLLVEKLGEERVIPFGFTRPSKSKLAYQLLALVNADRLKLYDTASAPRAISDELWTQIRAARYELPAPETMNFFVPMGEGHDDFLISLALIGEALNGWLGHAEPSAIIRPKPHLWRPGGASFGQRQWFKGDGAF